MLATFLALLLTATGGSLERMGIHVTSGAAPGYVDDAVCGNCHAERAKTYAHVGMARSFFAPRAENLIEDFDAPPFHHERSRQYFEMRKRGERIVFRRYELASDGAPIHVFEQPVDWILGSGRHARTYLYRTPGGELYQLPLSWYTATKEWRMAPGYDRPDHDGVTRRVRHECMFCHNAYPETAAVSESYWRSQTFPAKLPEGVGCQRCHGPGAKHVAAVLDGPREDVRGTIINPARLEVRRQLDVCYECHMQPAVALQGARVFGRDIYSFRPGELLADYVQLVDIEETDLRREDRFEINHHPYRLEQSRCFRESAGKLTCLTCHDPHRKVPEEQRAAHYRTACLSCHARPHRISEDCTSCHMQKRRTQDVVHVVMTDHHIRRSPGGADLLAPLEEREPAIEQVAFLRPQSAPSGKTGVLHRLLPVIRATGGVRLDDVLLLEQVIEEAAPVSIEPYLDLAMAQLRQRRYAQLEKTAALILERAPGQAQALEWLGLARAAQSRSGAAAIPFLEAAAKEEGRFETSFNLGLFLQRAGRTAEAIPHYERALAGRPNLAAAWIRLGEARHECGDVQGALDALRRAVEIEPRNERAKVLLVEVLGALGDGEEARRVAGER